VVLEEDGVGAEEVEAEVVVGVDEVAVVDLCHYNSRYMTCSSSNSLFVQRADNTFWHTFGTLLDCKVATRTQV
jgi:hypothetical protein